MWPFVQIRIDRQQNAITKTRKNEKGRARGFGQTASTTPHE
jgi:hypothetical protein